MKETQFLIQLGPADRLRESHIRRKQKIVSFTVQYETRWRRQWFAVVRYDTAHGFAHRDLYDIQGNALKTPLFILDYNHALTFAESDLRTNWRLYRERFIKDVRS